MINTAFVIPRIPFLGKPTILNDPPKNEDLIQYSHISNVNSFLNANCIDCRFFSGSPYLKCAVNPQKQPSAECPDFEAKT